MHLLFNLRDFVALEANDFVAVVHYTSSRVSSTYASVYTIQTRTIKPSNDRLFRRPLLYHKLHMRVGARKLLGVVVDIGAEVRRGWPGVAVLEDELAYLRYEGLVPI